MQDFQDLSLNVYSCSDIFLHGSSSSFDNYWWYQRYHKLFDQKSASFIWFTKARMNMNGTRVNFWEMYWRNFEKVAKWQKNTCGIPAFLQTLQVAIIYQRFPCVRKLILQENFLRYFQKHAFFVWCNRLEAVSGK